MKKTDLKLVQSRIPQWMLEEIKGHADIFGRSLSTELKFLLVDGLTFRKDQMEFAKPKRGK